MQIWKSSYIWIAGLLLIISIYGFATSANKISDPGQPQDSLLPLWYFIAAILMVVNGFLSHKNWIEQQKKKASEMAKEKE
jgi:hypothetical protein